MTNLTNLIKFKGTEIKEKGWIRFVYGNEEGILFHVLIRNNEDMSSFVVKKFEIFSKIIHQQYSSKEVLKYISTDLKSYVNLLSQIVPKLVVLEEKIGKNVICIDSLHGIKTFYDREGNIISTSLNIYDEEKVIFSF